MSFQNIDTAFVQSYGRNVQMISQQMESRLFSKVRVENPTGERHYFELYGTHGEPETVDVRHGDLNYQDTNFSRVAVDMIAYEDARLISKFDEVQMLVDPLSPVVTAQASSFGRKIDKLICEAALGTKLTGKTGSTSATLPSGNVVAVDDHEFITGSGNALLTPSKVLQAKAIMDANEVPDGERFIIVDGYNLTALLADVKASSKDFVSGANIEKGELKYWAGFEFIKTEQVQTDGSGYRRVIAGHKNGLGLAVNKNPMSDISENKGKSGLPYQAYYCMQGAATRLDDNAIVEIKCLATAA